MSAYRAQGDPYLAWSEANDFKGHAAVLAHTASIPLLLELGPGQWDRLQELRHSGRLAIAGVYGPRDRFVTAAAAREHLAETQALVKRLEFALPIAAGCIDQRVPAQQRTAPLSAPASTPKARPIFAVIDRGCAFLHEALRHADSPKRTRLLGLWDQGLAPTSGTAWVRPIGLGYGRELTPVAIDALIAALPDRAAEAAAYAGQCYLLDEGGVARTFAHGTHVMDVGGGRVIGQGGSSSAKPASDDLASAAPLIFVEVPSLGPGDTTGASSAAFMLDALKYIRLRAGQQVPVVVNISLGALAGPHDGSSMVEQAIDAFLEQDDRMAITMAAGNAGDAEHQPWHASGEVRSGPGDEISALRWRVRADDPTDSFVELWLKPIAKDAAPQVRVVAPGGETTAWLDLDGREARLPASAASAPWVTVYTRPAGARGTDAMVLVALAPCDGPRAAAPSGLWRVELRAESRVLFDAWVQRDEPVWGGGTPIQSFFESVSADARITGDGTLSSLATGKLTLVVGAADAQSQSATRYTSRGVADANRRRVQDLQALAIADETQSLPGLMAAGVISGSSERMGGTSVAAPRAARVILSEFPEFDVLAPPCLAQRVLNWVSALPAPGSGTGYAAKGRFGELWAAPGALTTSPANYAAAPPAAAPPRHTPHSPSPSSPG